MDVVPIYKRLEHDVTTFKFFVQGNTVVVEGGSRGALTDYTGRDTARYPWLTDKTTHE